MKLHTLVCLIAVALVMYRCQNSTSPDPGIGENCAIVSGVVYQPDGTTPAVGAKVMIRPVDALAVPTTGGFEKKSLSQYAVRTGDDGTFTFDISVGAGIYMVEAMSENNVAKIDSIEVQGRNEPVHTPSATLQPAGAIQGTIDLPEGCDPQSVFVLAFGIDRFARVNDDGTFCFSNLGSGTYSIRIVSTMDDYGVFDVNGIGIVSADTTDLGTIILSRDNLPIPQNLTCSCDTVSQQITVCWNKCEWANVTGYALYRRLADSNELFQEPIILGSVDDTSIIDESVFPGYRYEYRVAALGSDRYEQWVPVLGSDGYEYWVTTFGPDGFEYREAALGSDNGEGVKSEGVTVTAASYFTIDTLISVAESEIGNLIYMLDIAAAENGDLYFTDLKEMCIKVFDRDMRFKRSIGEELQIGPCGVEVDDNGMVIVLSTMSTFYLFDSSGVLVDSIADSTLIKSNVSQFDIQDSLIYCFGSPKGTPQSIYVYTFTGRLVRTWQYDEDGRIGCILKGNDEKVYVVSRMMNVDYFYRVIEFDTLGTMLNQITIPGCGGVEHERVLSIVYDDGNNLFYVTYVDDFEGSFRPSIVCGIKALDNSGAVIATYKHYVMYNYIASEAQINLLSSGEIVYYDCNQIDPKLVRFAPLER